MQKGRNKALIQSCVQVAAPGMARQCSALGGVLSSLLLLGGCTGDRQGINDPLLGKTAARPAVGATGAPTSMAVQPPPVSGSPTSNAALAGGTSHVLDSTNDLRISDTARHPESKYGQGPQSWKGTVLNRPEPAPAEIVKSVSSPITPTAVSTTMGERLGSYEAAQAQLAARRVNWQRLESWGDQGEWKFSCSVPNKQNPSMSRTYEARAKDYLEAIHAVLKQMDLER